MTISKPNLPEAAGAVLSTGYLTPSDIDGIAAAWKIADESQRASVCEKIINDIVKRYRDELDPAWQDDFKESIKRYLREFEGARAIHEDFLDHQLIALTMRLVLRGSDSNKGSIDITNADLDIE